MVVAVLVDGVVAEELSGEVEDADFSVVDEHPDAVAANRRPTPRWRIWPA